MDPLDVNINLRDYYSYVESKLTQRRLPYSDEQHDGRDGLRTRFQQRIDADAIASCSAASHCASFPSFSITDEVAAALAAGGSRSLASYGLGQSCVPFDSLGAAAYSQHTNSAMLMRAMAAQRSATEPPSLLATLQAQQRTAEYEMNNAMTSILARKQEEQRMMYQNLCNQQSAPPSTMLSSSDAFLASLMSFKSHHATLCDSNPSIADYQAASASTPINASASPKRMSFESHRATLRDGNPSIADHQAATASTPINSTCSKKVTPISSPHLVSLQRPSKDRLLGYGTFPMILHRALAELKVSTNGADIACFLPDGKSFHVRNQYLLVTEVLPLFFPNMRSFSSFQRQLNFYDFKRIGGTGIDRGSYCHELFLRDSPGLASAMKRTNIKGGGRKILAAAKAMAEVQNMPEGE